MEKVRLCPRRAKGRKALFSFLKRKRDLRVALSTQQSFLARNEAVYALAKWADLPSIRALHQIAAGSDEVNLRRSATSRLAAVSSPDAIRLLLDLLAAEAKSNNWVFTDACHGLSWNTITLKKLGDDALPPLARAGRTVLAWKCAGGGDRAIQRGALREILEILDKLDTQAARSARAGLEDILRERRTQELRGLTRTALESGAFEEAESAITEIAELGTPAALAALTTIRKQPVRYLEHQFETDNTDVETGYSPKWVSVARPSSELGETLKGEARARWDKA
jgi:hypothetical protein